MRKLIPVIAVFVLIITSSFIYISLNPRECIPFKVGDLRQGFKLANSAAMKEIEQLFKAHNVVYELRNDGTLMYPTNQIAIVRKLKRKGDPMTKEWCCVEIFNEQEEKDEFTRLLDINGVRYIHITTAEGFWNIKWEVEFEDSVDKIVQDLAIEKLNNAPGTQGWCN